MATRVAIIAMGEMGRHGIDTDVDDVRVGRVARRDMADINLPLAIGKRCNGSQGCERGQQKGEDKLFLHGYLSF